MKNFMSYLFVIVCLNICFFQTSFAEKKTKTEKESKFKIPDWLNLYMNMGYIYGKNHHLRSEGWLPSYEILNLDIKGKNVYDVSAGASILSPFKNIPVFFDVNISNLYDGFRKNYSNCEIYSHLQIYNWNTSHPFISSSIGSFKKYSDYMFNAAFSYSTNIKDRNESIFKNYALSASISRLYKNFTITPVISFLKKDSNHTRHYEYFYIWDREEDKHYKFNENIIGLELNISYAFKHITPYISFYDEIYNTQSIEGRKTQYLPGKFIKEVSTKKTGIIIKTGIHISTSNILDWFKDINGSIFHQSNVIEYHRLRLEYFL